MISFDLASVVTNDPKTVQENQAFYTVLSGWSSMRAFLSSTPSLVIVRLERVFALVCNC